MGIAPAEHERVFEEFYQATHPGRSRAAGLGLGLAIVQRLVQLMGGHVEADSTPGQGSCFRFIVPVALTIAASETP